VEGTRGGNSVRSDVTFLPHKRKNTPRKTQTRLARGYEQGIFETFKGGEGKLRPWKGRGEEGGGGGIANYSRLRVSRRK